ncbi:MerR family transcriptional regulator (plasmid) [Rhodococcus sp. ZPP]|nr:MerR family transcriptional regulator [Rhodococcus sp. ZPP]
MFEKPWGEADGARTGARPAFGAGVYGITVTAELSGVSIRSLRLYERHGPLTPDRPAGGTRRYSDDDLIRLQRITALVGAGVNLVGIARVLELEDAGTALAADNTTLRAERISRHD